MSGKQRRCRAALLGALVTLGGCAMRTPAGTDAVTEPTLEQAVAETMADARRALAEHGETPAAMEQIQLALARVAEHPSLRDRAPAGALHGSSTMKAEVLATDGDAALTLLYVRFLAGSATPVHDHLTWGVVRVIEGEDRYTAWERTDDGTNMETATLRVTRERVLRPGDSAYWLGPPHDLHRQVPVGGDATELVIAGKNLLGAAVLHHRHNYDPETGRISRPAGR
jgi:predicted metal-dependent enzyme (double-stranded beta helix superfamily)